MVVVEKENITGPKYKVYDIVYDKTGYPHFLLYIKGQWIRRSAKHYVPLWRCDYEANLQV